MAAPTIKTIVRTVKRETRLNVVIEAPHPPIVRGVAGLALVTEPPIVDVLPLMACDTVLRCVLEREGVVTIFAGREPMEAKERELRYPVIEMDVLRPRPLFVTRATLLALLIAMDVVTPVAVDATRLKLLTREFSAVTIAAIEIGMTAPQFPLPFFLVIETRALPS